MTEADDLALKALANQTMRAGMRKPEAMDYLDQMLFGTRGPAKLEHTNLYRPYNSHEAYLW